MSNAVFGSSGQKRRLKINGRQSYERLLICRNAGKFCFLNNLTPLIVFLIMQNADNRLCRNTPPRFLY
jgi:hypothetical protein